MNLITRRVRRLGVGADTATTVVLQALGAATAFAMNLVIVRVLTKTDFGIYTLTISVLVIVSGIGEFGLNPLVLPRLSIAGRAATPVLKAGMIIRAFAIVTGALLANVYLVLRGNAEILLYVDIGIVALLLSSRLIGMRQFFEMIWRLYGRTYVIPTVAIGDMLLMLAIVLGASRVGQLDILDVMLALAVTSVPGFVLLAWPLWRSGRLQSYLSQRVSSRYLRAIFFAALPIGVMVILGQAFGQLEVFVIDAALPTTEVAAFGAAVRPLMGLSFIATAIGAGIAPVIAQVYKGTRRDVSMEFLCSIASRAVLVVGLVVCAGTFLFSRQVMALFGQEYIAENYIFRYYGINEALTFLIILLDILLLFIGQRRQVLIGAVISFAVALVLEAALVGPYGIPGVIAAKVVAQVVLIGWQVYATREQMRSGVLAALVRLAPAAALLALVLWVSTPLGVVARSAVVISTLVLALLALRVVLPSEIRELRALRIT